MLDFTQEIYVWDVYSHYKNQHLVMPLDDMPHWLRDSIGNFGLFEAIDREDEKRAREANARKNQLRQRR